MIKKLFLALGLVSVLAAGSCEDEPGTTTCITFPGNIIKCKTNN